MIPYVVGGIAFLLFFYTPLVQYFSPGTARIPRTPRPAFNESLLAIDAPNETAPNCVSDAYSIHILSKAPLVLYIENFLSPEERQHLLDISEPIFEPSTITSDGQATHQNATIRDSSVALIPRTEPVRCIERRALSMQGWKEDLWVERLRTQRYESTQHYAHHFDWGSGARGWGRVSSIMVWVDAVDVEGGGTEFPLLKRRKGPEWCRWIECDERDGDDSEELGVTFKPVAGNAVLWENFRPDGTGKGWEESWHAGLPVRKGVKTGLNIWSWGRLE